MLELQKGEIYMDKDRERAKESLQYMSGKEKIAHFIRYYKVHAIVVCLVIGTAISIIGKFTFNKKPDGCLRMGVRAQTLDPESIEQLPEYLAEKFPEMTEGGEKAFYSEQFFAGYKNYEAEEAMVVSNKLDACVAAGTLDVLVGDLDTLKSEVGRGVYMDLRNVFSEEELNTIKELSQKRVLSEDGEGVVYIDYKVSSLNGRTESIEKNVPYLICISGGDDKIDACVSNRETYLVVIWNTNNLDNVKTLIWSLLEDSTEK